MEIVGVFSDVLAQSLTNVTGMVYPLVGWVTFQAIVLIGQEYMGASFFIPKGVRRSFQWGPRF